MAPYCQIISRGLGNGLVIGNLGNKGVIYSVAGATTCGVGVCSSDILNSRATQIEIKNCEGNVGGESSERGNRKMTEIKKINCNGEESLISCIRNKIRDCKTGLVKQINCICDAKKVKNV